jgi:acyl dehydratase
VPKYYFEDFSAGKVIEIGPRVVTRDEIVAFASEFDPQPMHLSEEGGRASMLGEFSASGWHTCCLMMRMVCDGFLLETASMGAPGVDEVKWLKPVHPGDSLTVRCTVEESRVSRSKPDRGFIRLLFEVFNGQGERVMTLTCPQMMQVRPAGQAQ